MRETKIVLADDHEVVRQGLRALLNGEPGFTVVGEASDGLQATELTERLEPDVLVVDLIMPGLGGLDVTRQVTHRTKTRVVILSMHSSEAYLLEALRNGAHGYVVKGASATELIHAIKEAAERRTYLSPPFSNESVEAYMQKAKEAAADPYETLTSRERQVFHLAVEGLTSVQAAERLSISPRTAETHKAHVLRKLGLHGQTDLIHYAVMRGILKVGG